MADSRRLADRQLKSTCEAFIDYCGDFLIGPTRVYLAKVSVSVGILPCIRHFILDNDLSIACDLVGGRLSKAE